MIQVKVGSEPDLKGAFKTTSCVQVTDVTCEILYKATLANLVLFRIQLFCPGFPPFYLLLANKKDLNQSKAQTLEISPPVSCLQSISQSVFIFWYFVSEEVKHEAFLFLTHPSCPTHITLYEEL